MNLRLHRSLVAASLSFLLLSASNAATCPFDNGGSDALNDGLVLTRYALGITGAPLIASTRYASLDPLQVKNNIECVGCALDMNGDGQIDAVDTTIIARHLAGFTGASLTAGLALGSAPSASRTDTASITSFLVNGCAVGGSLPSGTLDQTLRYSAANTLTATDDFKVLADGGLVATDGDQCRLCGEWHADRADSSHRGRRADDVVPGQGGVSRRVRFSHPVGRRQRRPVFHRDRVQNYC